MLVLLIKVSLRMVPDIILENIILGVGILKANIFESFYTIAWHYLNENISMSYELTNTSFSKKMFLIY